MNLVNLSVRACRRTRWIDKCENKGRPSNSACQADNYNVRHRSLSRTGLAPIILISNTKGILPLISYVGRPWGRRDLTNLEDAGTKPVNYYS